MNGIKRQSVQKKRFTKEKIRTRSVAQKKSCIKKKSTKEAQYERKDGMKEKRFINMSVMKIQQAAQNRSDFKNI